jgi:hypothetical protein
MLELLLSNLTSGFGILKDLLLSSLACILMKYLLLSLLKQFPGVCVDKIEKVVLIEFSHCHLLSL